MRLLVFGGTVFLSRAVASEALRRGHEVTCASRGVSGSVPVGANHLTVDRDADLPTDIASSPYGPPFDAVIDIARKPSQVRKAAAAFADAHWVFISTISVYDDQGDTVSPIEDDVDVSENPAAYGAMKVACEQIVRAGTQAPTIIRPGLIAGPGDPSGRFTYWPARLAEPGPVLVPGSPTDPTQVIDVRDLAAWIVGCAETQRGGTFDGTAPSVTWGDFIDQVSRGVNSDPELSWVDPDFLTDQQVQPWVGPNAVPLWLPQPDQQGPDHHALTTIDVTRSLAAGLSIRPLAETAGDTLEWLRATPEAATTGISREREAQLLRAWSRR